MTQQVVVIGGGTGSFSILSGLRDADLGIRSIVSTVDSGGDSGELRDAFGVLPPGDLRRCLIALSQEARLMRDLFGFRFAEPPLQGRNFGNLFFLALTRMLGSEREAVEAIGRILNIRGEVLPVTWEHAHLHAELESGQIVEGEAAIDARGRVRHSGSDPKDRIRRVFLVPTAAANPDALEAIALCDVIILAPGDIYTSTIPNLLFAEMAEALQRARAPLVYVCNLMTKHGETDGWKASQHVDAIRRYAGRVPDVVLVHSEEVPEQLRKRYACEHAEPVEVDEHELHRLGVRNICGADIMSTTSVARHDPERSATVLMQIIRDLGSYRIAGSRVEGAEATGHLG